LITVHFELSIITGTRAISGSAAISFEKGRHRIFSVEQALVHVDVDDLRAIFDLLACDLDRGGIIVRENQLRTPPAVTLVRSPILTKLAE
jgi:hypothetical protein